MSAFDESEKAAVYWVLSKLESTEYRFQCLNFVEDAYEKGAGMEFAGYYYTKEVADKLDVGRNTGVPLFGAFVFYDCWGIINRKYRNWGHVGLLIGEGKVVHALDKVRVNNYMDV